MLRLYTTTVRHTSGHSARCGAISMYCPLGGVVGPGYELVRSTRARKSTTVVTQSTIHSPALAQWLADIAALYHLNDERLQVRAEPTQYAAADAALRAGVQAMQERRERELAQQPKLPEACAKVLRSLRNHWQGLTLFVEDPDLPMDNNQAERALRGPVVGRKNYYGSGAQWSGELSAALFSLFHTLERWRINPRTWLTEYLNACAVAGGRVPADFERFLPWNRRAARVPRASPAQVVDSRAA